MTARAHYIGYKKKTFEISRCFCDRNRRIWFHWRKMAHPNMNYRQHDRQCQLALLCHCHKIITHLEQRITHLETENEELKLNVHRIDATQLHTLSQVQATALTAAAQLRMSSNPDLTTSNGSVHLTSNGVIHSSKTSRIVAASHANQPSHSSSREVKESPSPSPSLKSMITLESDVPSPEPRLMPMRVFRTTPLQGLVFLVLFSKSGSKIFVF